MNYLAPSLILGNKIGLKLHNDWGLSDHAALQNKLLPTGNVGDGYNRDLVEEIIYGFNGVKRYTDPFLRYHIALGMISQFDYSDIRFFVDVPYEHRPRAYLQIQEEIEHKNQIRIGYIPSPSNLIKIQYHLELNSR